MSGFFQAGTMFVHLFVCAFKFATIAYVLTGWNDFRIEDDKKTLLIW